MTISGFSMQRYTLPSKNGQLTKRELAGHRKSFQRIVHYYMLVRGGGSSGTTTLLVFLMKLHCIQFAKNSQGLEALSSTTEEEKLF